MTFLVISLAILFALILGGVPIAFGFGFSSWVLRLLGVKAASAISAFRVIDSFVLMAVPLFVFMGHILTESGTSRRLINFANAIVGRVAKGGLGVCAVLGGMFFGACSGSSIAAVAANMTILQPTMTELGYPKRYTTALIGCVGTLGQLIPPSVTLIVFGVVANVSIVALFMGELIPAIILAFLMSAVNIYLCRKFAIIIPPKVGNLAAQIKELVKSGFKASWGIVLMVFIAGGIYSGTFTPSEAAGAGSVYVILIGFLAYKGLTRKNFFGASLSAGRVTGAVFFILMLNLVLVRIYIMHQVPQQLSDLIVANVENRYLIMLILNIFLIIIGMLVDDINAALIAGSLFMPLVTQIGMSPIHFGAMLAINLGLGGLTPPVCNYLYVASRISGENLLDFFKYVIPFILFAFIPTLLLTTYIPQLSLTLPELMGYVTESVWVK